MGGVNRGSHEEEPADSSTCLCRVLHAHQSPIASPELRSWQKMLTDDPVNLDTVESATFIRLDQLVS